VVLSSSDVRLFGIFFSGPISTRREISFSPSPPICWIRAFSPHFFFRSFSTTPTSPGFLIPRPRLFLRFSSSMTGDLTSLRSMFLLKLAQRRCQSGSVSSHSTFPPSFAPLTPLVYKIRCVTLTFAFLLDFLFFGLTVVFERHFFRPLLSQRDFLRAKDFFLVVFNPRFVFHRLPC